MHCTECSSQGVWVAEVPPTERVDEFPYATLCVWLNEKSFWHHYDINNLTQDYRKVKEESKETVALEVVTDGKNDKTEKNDKEYVHNKRTWDGTCVLFCVPPSFVLIT